MTSALPLSARLCWWGTSWLRGTVSPDELIEEVAGAGALLETLAEWRRQGCRGLSLALPIEGDPLGLGGPPDFNAVAMEAGEAVLAVEVDFGLVPDGSPPAWLMRPARHGQVPDVPEADQALRGGLIDAGRQLASLDVARWRPEIADALMNLRHRPALNHPETVPPVCVDLAARALQALGIVELASDDDGGGVVTTEIDQRLEVLRGLERTGRRALAAACSPQGWPPPGAGAR